MFTEFDLDPQLLKAIEALSFKKPTPVQEQAIPAALDGQDLMVCAQTGSGKSAAFLLPTLHTLMHKKVLNSGTRALILVPTRELARQLFKQCEALAKFTKLTAGLITGGAEFKFQAAVFRKNPEIIIATPGRLIDHMSNKIGLLDDVEFLILDEADRMLDMGFADDVIEIASHCAVDRQTLLFSATLKQQGMRHVIKQVLQDPVVINVDSIKGEHAGITQELMLADDDKHKERILTWLLANETYRQAIVFSNTKIKTDQIYHYLQYHKVNVGVLHGDMTQDERNHVMQQMQQGHITVLIATDVAARGLDVKNIDLVINIDMPRSGDEYVHRIGRTGRAGQTGLAISIVDTTECNLKSSIERYLKIEMKLRKVKAVEGRYKGPKKVKANGKAAGKKKKEKATDKKKVVKKIAKKPAIQTRDVAVEPENKPSRKQNNGKVQKPSPAKPRFGDGTAPFKPKKSS